jgi:3-phenylpropionate/cinnamic acid dioxygenase small subunit
MSNLINPKALTETARDVLLREAVMLDERRWDEWLAMWTEDCEFWVPTWKSEDELASDPEKELSHIYYASRAGLEDRIARIRTGKSPASTPLRRTTHQVGNVMVTATGSENFSARASWTCHVFDPHDSKSHVLFGRAEYLFVLKPAGWLIARKKTVINNDYLPSMVDVYCI